MENKFQQAEQKLEQELIEGQQELVENWGGNVLLFSPKTAKTAEFDAGYHYGLKRAKEILNNL